jgi:phage-related protein
MGFHVFLEAGQRMTGAVTAFFITHDMPVALIDYLYQFMYILSMPNNEKLLEWIGSSHKDLMALPADVRRLFGFALSLAQAGDRHDAAKVLKGFGGAGVLEVVEDDVGGTYRAVYTVKFAEAVFVLHCFQKKSKRGIATPKEEMDIVHARLKVAEAYAKELRNGKTAH